MGDSEDLFDMRVSTSVLLPVYSDRIEGLVRAAVDASLRHHGLDACFRGYRR